VGQMSGSAIYQSAHRGEGPIFGDKGAAGGGLLLKSTTVSYLDLTWLIWRQELLSMSELLGG